MKKQHILILILLLNSLLIIAQNNQVSLNSGYANQSFFSMQDGEILNIENNNWDIAFSTDAFSAAIRTNDGKGVELYTYHIGDTSSWGNINTSTPNILINPMYNSDTDWERGAFDTNQIGGFDYGWGVYNLQNHHIVGDSLFVIKTINANWKKLWIERKVSGEYQFKYANLDGSNELSQNILASNYNDKRFIYFSLDQNIILDREPILSDWDITFTKYITPVQGMPYAVTGVLCNTGIEIAEADNITNPLTYTDYLSHSFETDINTIGYDWKTYQGSYITDQDRCFFIKDYEQNIWRLFFTDFEGTSTGIIQFNTELVAATSISEADNTTIAVYPNPAFEDEEIQLIYDVKNKDIIITICDLSGKIVYQLKPSQGRLKSHTISKNKLKKGTYIISATSNQEKLTSKLIIY